MDQYPLFTHICIDNQTKFSNKIDTYVNYEKLGRICSGQDWSLPIHDNVDKLMESLIQKVKGAIADPTMKFNKKKVNRKPWITKGILI